MLKLLQTYYSAFNAQDVPGMLDLLSDDIEHHVNQGEVRKGKALFEEFLHMMNRHYQEKLVDFHFYQETSSDTQRGAAEFVVEGRYLVSQEGLPEARGQEYRLPAGGFFEARNGMLTKIVTYYNLPEWIRQVS